MKTLEQSQREMREAIRETAKRLAAIVLDGGPKSFGGALQFASLAAFIKPTDMWCDAYGDLIAAGLTPKQCYYIQDFEVGMTHADGTVEKFDGSTIQVIEKPSYTAKRIV